MKQVVLVLVASVGLLFGESFFNPRGLGEEWGQVDARTFGWYALGPANPAFGIKMSAPTFSATTLAEFISGSDNNQQRNIGGFVPMNFMGCVPLPFDFGCRVGLGQRFNEDFSVYSDSVVSDLISYRKHIIGRGGMYGADFGLGKSFFKNLVVGTNFTWFFGSSVEEWIVEVFEGDYITKDTTEAIFSGYNFNLGGSFQSKLGTVTAFWSAPIRLNIASEVHSVQKVQTFERELMVPNAWGLGLSINGPKNTGFFFDFQNKPWAGSNQDLGFTNGLSFAGGLELKNIPLAIGYKNRVWYVQSANNKKINEQALFVKGSRPLSYWGDFSVALEFLQRGDGSLTETGLRLMTTLSFEEPWKKRQRRWGGG